jgi:hypothetical protein
LPVDHVPPSPPGARTTRGSDLRRCATVSGSALTNEGWSPVVDDERRSTAHGPHHPTSSAPSVPMRRTSAAVAEARHRAVPMLGPTHDGPVVVVVPEVEARGGPAPWPAAVPGGWGWDGASAAPAGERDASSLQRSQADTLGAVLAAVAPGLRVPRPRHGSPPSATPASAPYSGTPAGGGFAQGCDLRGCTVKFSVQRGLSVPGSTLRRSPSSSGVPRVRRPDDAAWPVRLLRLGRLQAQAPWPRAPDAGPGPVGVAVAAGAGDRGERLGAPPTSAEVLRPGAAEPGDLDRRGAARDPAGRDGRGDEPSVEGAHVPHSSRHPGRPA